MIPLEKLANIYDREWCRRHRKPPLRLLTLLQRRELGLRKPGAHLIDGSRDFYQCFKLECTSSMQSSSLTPIRFTPDGQQFIQFNIAASEVIVSRYNGVTTVLDPTNLKPQKLLTKHFSQSIQGTLCRDLCLITADSQHMIVGSVIQLPEQNAIMTRNLKNNESVTTGFNIEHTTFWTIDLQKGIICDSLRLEFDSIRLSGGIYLVDRLLGILSVQHQTIHIYQIDKLGGAFSRVVEIGRFLFEDDDLHLGIIPSNPRIENVFLGFRNRFINYLYLAHKRAGSSIEFLRSIHHYLLLKIQRMQFLGPEVLLLRLGVGTGTETNGPKDDGKFFCMFVLLDWRRAEILAIYNRYSDTLFKLYVNNTESFQNGSIVQNYFPTTMEHCQTLRQQQHDNIIEALVASSSPESTTRIRNRTLNTLPCIGIGIPLATPFLDAYMFSFDDRLLNCIESGRLSVNADFKIYCRKSCSPVFSVDLSKFTDQDAPCRIVFHPTDPLFFLSKHYCVDSPTHIFTPPLSESPWESVQSEDMPGPNSQR